MAQDLRDLPPSNYQTYEASETVRVDDSTVDFLEETDVWFDEVVTREEETRRAKVHQALFAQGSRDFLAGKTDPELMANSDAYFQGQDYGRRIHNDIAKVAKERFPLPSKEEYLKRLRAKAKREAEQMKNWKIDV